MIKITEDNMAKYVALSVTIHLMNMGFPVSVQFLKEIKELIYKDITLANSIELSIKSFDKEMEKL